MKNIKSFGSMALLLGLAINSQGTTVTPSNSSSGISAATVAEVTYLNATTPEAYLNAALSGSEGLNPPAGVLSSYVYAANSTANSLGGLIFVYQLSISGDQANTLTLTSFAGDTSLDVDYDALPITTTALLGGLTPSLPGATIGAQLSGGGTLTFALNPAQFPGTNSVYLIVNTPNLSFGQGPAGVQDDLQSVATDLAPVPEPSTIMSGTLLLLPFGASTLRILRKNRTV